MKAYSTASVAVLGDLIHSEYDSTYTTDKGVLLAGSGSAREIPKFSVVAKVNLGSVTVTPGAVVGTGNGSIGTVTADSGAPAGVYQVVIIEPASDGGTFQVFRPTGELDGTGTIGAAYNGTINFTLADGATDFTAGARIPVTVSYAAGSGKVVRWDPTAVNGAQTVVGISLFDAEAPDGVDDEITWLARGPVIVRKESIVFHDGATTDQKNAAYAALEALGIQCRQTG